MNITQSGFYKLSSKEIRIAHNIEVVLFDDGTQNRKVIVWEWSQVKFYGVIKWQADRDNVFMQAEENSSLTVRYILTSKEHKKITAKIFSKLSASHTSSDVQITSVVSEAGDINLDGSIQIDKDIIKAGANLIEENLFLGSTGRVQGIPTLLVASDDVKASHACRMEKISDEKLFYLRSRGIDKTDATYLMIESYVTAMIGWLAEVDSDFHTELFEAIMSEI